MQGYIEQLVSHGNAQSQPFNELEQILPSPEREGSCWALLSPTASPRSPHQEKGTDLWRETLPQVLWEKKETTVFTSGVYV